MSESTPSEPKPASTDRMRLGLAFGMLAIAIGMLIYALTQDEVPTSFKVLPLVFVMLSMANLSRSQQLPADVPITEESWKNLAMNPATKIQAIKVYRQLHTASLVDAKTAVEQYIQEQRSANG
ncbi:hypothetical protein [Tuwongella immobilis]|uniref:: Ribosomal_L12 n=1 Tax=Tuwongella immobilis TaxID=692036 RepID=A0A6C2YVN6_9BACT|nr:hypothetical protein [Tuwongella immobilis]VIP05233.1 : Ribosomal_L12 [Tuwongella immobilis]VTS07822.1 : Ribosomal_L12 [Tuwongella immobilis]